MMDITGPCGSRGFGARRGVDLVVVGVGRGVRDDGHHRPVWITRGGARRGVDLVVGLGGV